MSVERYWKTKARIQEFSGFKGLGVGIGESMYMYERIVIDRQ
jgi:hypothetical protein